MLPHAAGDFIDGKVDALVHVLGFGGGIDHDMVCTKKDNIGLMPATSFDIKYGLGLDDAWVFQVNSADLLHGVLPEGISDVFVTHGHGDVWVYCLHNELR